MPRLSDCDKSTDRWPLKVEIPLAFFSFRFSQHDTQVAWGELCEAGLVELLTRLLVPSFSEARNLSLDCHIFAVEKQPVCQWKTFAIGSPDLICQDDVVLECVLLISNLACSRASSACLFQAAEKSYEGT